MTTVIKRDKRRQAFSKSKLERSIQRAAKEAKLKTARAKEIAKDVAEGVSKAIARKASVRSTELRKRVFRRLESRSNAIISAWRKYDKKMR